MTKISVKNIESALARHIAELEKKIKDNFPQNSKYSIAEILGAQPQKLDEIASWLDSLDDTEQKDFDYIKAEYKSFTSKKEEYDAYELAEVLGVNVCPYCNRNYTFTVINKKVAAKQGEITRPEFDHFYGKDKYPILALSFYNLIPSCHTCNSTMKGKAEFNIYTHIYPHTESLDERAKFVLTVKNVDFYRKESGIDLTLKPNLNSDTKAANSINAFKLNELYEKHKDIALELIQKAQMYNDSYIDELMKNYEGTLFKNREDLTRLIFGGYITDEEISDRPLSKLTKDILEQLEIS